MIAAQIKMLVQPLTIHSQRSLTNLSRLPSRSSERITKISISPPSRYALRLDSPDSPRDWRRGRDSNPRRVLARSGFQDRRDRPLCHLSNDRLDLWIDGLLDERSSSIPPIHLSNYPAIQPIPHRLARQEGLEPPTNGFGDRYSAN